LCDDYNVEKHKKNYIQDILKYLQRGSPLFFFTKIMESILTWCERCRTISLTWSLRCPFCMQERKFDIEIKVENKRSSRKRKDGKASIKKNERKKLE